MIYFYTSDFKNTTKRFFKNVEQTLEDYIILITCERAEIYTTKKIKLNLKRQEGKEALTHLLFVCCGIKSTVIGEIEILEQISDAFDKAVREEHCSDELKGYFSFAIDKSKEIRKISGIFISFSDKFIDKVIRAHKNLPIIVVGTGKLGTNLIRILKNKNYQSIFISSKDIKRAELIGRNYDIPTIGLKEINNNSVILLATEHITKSKVDTFKNSCYVYDLRHKNYSNLVKEMELTDGRLVDINKIKELISMNIKKFSAPSRL